MLLLLFLLMDGMRVPSDGEDGRAMVISPGYAARYSTPTAPHCFQAIRPGVGRLEPIFKLICNWVNMSISESFLSDGILLALMMQRGSPRSLRHMPISKSMEPEWCR